MMLQGFIAFTLNRVFMTLYRSTRPGHHESLGLINDWLPVHLCPKVHLYLGSPYSESRLLAWARDVDLHTYVDSRA